MSSGRSHSARILSNLTVHRAAYATSVDEHGTADLWNRARTGDRRALARLISNVEQDAAGVAEVVGDAYRTAGKAWVIGVTGAPGAGKSTLVDRLIGAFRAEDRSVAALVVDPSSPFSGGSLLGDRVRMQEHVSDPGVYIRSMSSRGHLGGVADPTAKVVAVLDSAGFDVVIIETVGVGQGEVEVAEIADTTLVVLTPGSGDDIQVAKAGLLEIGSVFVVNKSDLAGVEDIVRHLTQMLEMSPSGEATAEIVRVSASGGSGIDELMAAMEQHRARDGSDASARSRRLESVLRRAVISSLARRVAGAELPPDLIDDVVARRVDPWSAAQALTSSS